MVAVGYRSLLRLDDSEDAVSAAEQQVQSWLRSKRLIRNDSDDSWREPGVHRFGSAAQLSVTKLDSPKDASRRRLFRLIETNPHGTWSVSLFASSLPQARAHHETLLIEAGLDGVDESQAIERVAPPRVVRSLLESVRAGDGSTTLYARPQVIRHGYVEEVVDAILDPNRTAAVVVAGSLGAETDTNWYRIVQALTKHSVGVATAFVVYDDAMDELSRALPESHMVRRGRIRTFAPAVDLSNPLDGVRHRVLGPATLARSVNGTSVAETLVKRHAIDARRRLVEQDLPADVRRTVDLLRKESVTQDRSSIVRRLVEEQTRPTAGIQASLDISRSAPPKSDSTLTLSLDAQDTLLGILKQWTGDARFSIDQLARLDEVLTVKAKEVEVASEQLDEAATAQLKLEAELRETRSRIEDLELELFYASNDARENEREALTLRHRIARSDHPQDAFVEPASEEWEAPTTVSELIARITPGEGQHKAFDYVEFTGDPDTAAEIDKRDPFGRYAAALWDYVHVLHDFADLRAGDGFAGNVHTYLNDDTVDGFKCPTSRHAPTESETVLSNKAWHAERMLPVPTTISSTGVELMDAHFKPTHNDTFAPRMHYFDDTARSGRVYIGYIGRHLHNTKS